MTFVAVGTSGVSFIKMFGIGLALAIVMDATVIRGLLVPTVMRLAGEANCWAPAPLRRMHNRWASATCPLPSQPRTRGFRSATRSVESRVVMNISSR